MLLLSQIKSSKVQFLRNNINFIYAQEENNLRDWPCQILEILILIWDFSKSNMWSLFGIDGAYILCWALILVYEWLLLPLYVFVHLFLWWKFQDLSYCIWLTNFAGFNFSQCVFFLWLFSPQQFNRSIIYTFATNSWKFWAEILVLCLWFWILEIRVYEDEEEWFRSIFANSTKEEAIRNQYEFFVQRMGGPPLYSQRKGYVIGYSIMVLLIISPFFVQHDCMNYRWATNESTSCRKIFRVELENFNH